MPPMEYWKQGKPASKDDGDRVVGEFEANFREDREEASPITESLETRAQRLRKRKGEIDLRIIDALNALSSARGVMLVAKGEDKKNAEVEVSRIEQERLKAIEESAILQEELDEIQKRIHRLKTHALNVEEQL